MNDFISREEAIEALSQHFFENGYDYDKTVELLSELDAHDVAPVVHSHWEEYENTIVCKACGEKWSIREDGDFVIIEAKNDLKFCPSCGAKMDA